MLFLIDTLRADRLGAYGYDAPTSPHIDALAREAVVFERGYSAAPWTLPSVVSLFTSTFPCEHGVVIEGQKSSIETLAERVKPLGYSTASFFANVFAGPMSGMDRGFDRCEYQPATDASVVEQWLDTLPDGPSLLYVHNVEPHDPYKASNASFALFWQRFVAQSGSPEQQPTATRKLIEGLWRGYRQLTKIDFVRKRPPGTTDNSAGQERAMEAIARHADLIDVLYDAAVRDADARLGRIVATLKQRGRWDDTLFVLMADHGEELGDHGGWQHDQSVYDELVRVPLMIKFPASSGIAPARVEQAVSLVDLMPTILDYCGQVPESDATSGRSLLPLIDGAEGAEWVVPAMRINRKKFYKPYKEQRGDLNVVVCRDQWKGIWNAQPATVELYDLREDPREQRNLAGQRPELTAAIREHATAWLEACAARSIGEAPEQEELTPEQLERLRTLGYVK